MQEEIKLWMQDKEPQLTVADADNDQEQVQVWGFKEITLATASLFASTLRQAAHEFQQLTRLPLNVQEIVNIRLGETITVAGLLMAADVLAQLESNGYGDLVVLPRVMFDHPDTISLDDVSPQEVANKLACPVASGGYDGRCMGRAHRNFECRLLSVERKFRW